MPRLVLPIVITRRSGSEDEVHVEFDWSQFDDDSLYLSDIEAQWWETKRQGSTQALADVYEAFTLLPGSTGDYGQSDFARDLFILDRSGLTRTKAGASLSLPASTGTKSARGTFTFVAPDGELVTYFGVRFGPSS